MGQSIDRTLYMFSEDLIALDGLPAGCVRDWAAVQDYEPSEMLQRLVLDMLNHLCLAAAFMLPSPKSCTQTEYSTSFLSTLRCLPQPLQDKMRSEYGKLMYMLMDSNSSEIQELLEFK